MLELGFAVGLDNPASPSLILFVSRGSQYAQQNKYSWVGYGLLVPVFTLTDAGRTACHILLPLYRITVLASDGMKAVYDMDK